MTTIRNTRKHTLAKTEDTQRRLHRNPTRMSGRRKRPARRDVSSRRVPEVRAEEKRLGWHRNHIPVKAHKTRKQQTENKQKREDAWKGPERRVRAHREEEANKEHTHAQGASGTTDTNISSSNNDKNKEPNNLERHMREHKQGKYNEN